jgi:hypothetical protein
VAACWVISTQARPTLTTFSFYFIWPFDDFAITWMRGPNGYYSGRVQLRRLVTKIWNEFCRFYYSIHISSIPFDLILLLGVDRTCRLPMTIMPLVPTHLARLMSSSRWYDGLVHCQVSQSAPPFLHTRLSCHIFGFHLLFVSRLVIVSSIHPFDEVSSQGLASWQQELSAGMSRGRLRRVSLSLTYLFQSKYV